MGSAVLLTLLAIFVLLLFSAFFSGSETGLTAVSRAKIHRLKTEGNRRAELVSRLREDKNRLIGAILLGNNTVNIAASALATALAISYFGDEGVVYVTVVMTLLVLIFAEVLPKTYAFRNAERVALTVSPVFIVLVRVLSPITHAVQMVVESFFRLLGVREAEDEDGMSGTEVLRGAIELHHEEGAVVKHDRDMLGSILDLKETTVEEIMIHRKHMETLNIQKPSADIIEQVLSSRYTRIPMWKDNPENIVGVLHVKALLKEVQGCRGDLDALDISAVLMPPWFIPTTTTLTDQLRAFLERKTHFALVVDEYGALLGLITLEDILEEIVGQISDEHEEEEQKRGPMREEAKGCYMVEGTMTVRDLNRELDWDLPDHDAVTVAGLVIHQAERIPETGQVFHFFNTRFEIVEKQRNQITKLRVSALE